MEIPLYIVDAFASRHFSGNPAAVCPLVSWPDDGLMQDIAAENNLSETAFFVPVENGFELRWFTPQVEVDLCGHATLASAFVLSMDKSTAAPDYRFQTRSGELLVRHTDDWYYLDFPVRELESPDNADVLARQVEEACGARPVQVTRAAATCIAELESEAQVQSVTPVLAKVKAMEFNGLIVTAPGRDCDFVSRFFAPRVGIDEDPVTGSIHCGLIPYWSRKTGKKELLARQVSARGGELRCRLLDGRVEIGGQAILYSQGKIDL